MHFHLGPGSKSMYVWDEDRYVTAPGEKRQNNMDFRRHLPTAIARTFHEGDVYFMPENRFHLGTQDGLSIGIACWSNNRSNLGFAERLLYLVKQDHLKNSDLMLKSDRLPVDDLSGLDPTLELFSPPGFATETFRESLRRVYKDFRYALFSNAGLRNAPLPDDTEVAIGDDARVRVNSPYRLLHAPGDGPGRITLYVRGARLAMNDIGGLRPLVDALNGGHEFSFAAMLDILGHPWSTDTARYLLALLRRHRGILVS
jgi:hypothetical protein